MPSMEVEASVRCRTSRCSGRSRRREIGVTSTNRSCGARAAERVRPARTSSWGCKSPRKETIPNEANCNCERATNRGEEAGSEAAGR
jgi:hypothetical protein